MGRTPSYYSYYKLSKGNWVLVQALGEDGRKAAELCGWKVERLLEEEERDNAQVQVKNKKKNT